MEEKDNNTNELEELMLEEIDINEDPDESDDSKILRIKIPQQQEKGANFLYGQGF